MKGYLILSHLAIALSIAQKAFALGFDEQQQQPLRIETENEQPVAKPNIIFILVDDQDSLLDSISYMPNLNKHLTQQGTFYRNHFVTTAICCPSRVSLLTGRLAHNTNVTDVSPPYGGYLKFVERGFNENYLLVWLQNAGYNTLYTGKLFNSHTIDNYNKSFANGYEGQYTTDILKEKSLRFLDSAISHEDPFFLTIAPVAPHSNVLSNGPLVPGADLSFSASNISGKAKTSFRGCQDSPQRLRALQPVDELISEITDVLNEKSILDNTYIIYTSDNGYHIGQHRLQAGKECGFEEDIRVTFIIRGPGILPNYEETAVTTHIDIAPTIFDIAGLPLRSDFDEDYGELDDRELLGVSLEKVVHRLDALLLVLQSCQKQNCIRPWDVLHPEGKVNTLKDALHEKYGDFYQVQSKVSFSRCEYGYIPDAEGPQTGLTYRDGVEWHQWV
ncbi:arylsulfatase [Penicillium citrinum]|uniref:Arylsulfatase n=1 Tax=Penicillium citrinum TaxID=5077 RepID=A0A9W9NXU5_PENCI|nr:arylsulfatase [Penicillium citrinum]KAJ5231749.1 arylsulfatase [Penicillium citrinum]